MITNFVFFFFGNSKKEENKQPPKTNKQAKKQNMRNRLKSNAQRGENTGEGVVIEIREEKLSRAKEWSTMSNPAELLGRMRTEKYPLNLATKKSLLILAKEACRGE